MQQLLLGAIHKFLPKNVKKN